MPSKTPKEARLMAAVAHGWHKPGGGGPSVAVAKEFNQADKGTSMLSEGSKGRGPQAASYAAGGSVLGRTRSFLKEEVEFREPDEGKMESRDVTGDTADEDQKYGKSGPGAGKGCVAPPPARGKQLKAVVPRK